MDAKTILVSSLPIIIGVTVGMIAATKIQEAIAAKG